MEFISLINIMFLEKIISNFETDFIELTADSNLTNPVIIHQGQRSSQQILIYSKLNPLFSNTFI